MQYSEVSKPNPARIARNMEEVTRLLGVGFTPRFPLYFRGNAADFHDLQLSEFDLFLMNVLRVLELRERNAELKARQPKVERLSYSEAAKVRGAKRRSKSAING